VVADIDDIDYLLELTNFAMPHRTYGYEDVVSTWSGCRPLIKPKPGQSSSSVSRQHQIYTGPKGLITIAGGKLTTARAMGEHMIDEAMRQMGYDKLPASRTGELPISGGDIGADFDAHVRQVIRALKLDPNVGERLGMVYGGNFDRIIEYIKADPESGKDLGDGHHVCIAELQYALEHEMVLTLRDFMERRATRFVWSADGGLSITGPIVEEMANHLGWDEVEKTKQVAEYTDWVQANRVPMDLVLRD
jgi:glycerol-3-phosphate dehydrogenase